MSGRHLLSPKKPSATAPTSEPTSITPHRRASIGSFVMREVFLFGSTNAGSGAHIGVDEKVEINLSHAAMPQLPRRSMLFAHKCPQCLNKGQSINVCMYVYESPSNDKPGSPNAPNKNQDPKPREHQEKSELPIPRDPIRPNRSEPREKRDI